MSTVLIQAENSAETLNSKLSVSMFTIMKLQEDVMFHVPSLSILSQEQWIQFVLDHSDNYSVQTTLSSAKVVLVTTGLRAIILKVLN